MSKDLVDIANNLLNQSPSIQKMRGHPEFANWAQHLKILSSRDELLTIRKTLETITQEAFAESEPLSNLPKISPEICLTTSGIAEEINNENRYTALVLALVSLYGFAFYIQENPDILRSLLRPGRIYSLNYQLLKNLPCRCAIIALNNGAFESARELVEFGYEALNATTPQLMGEPVLTIDLQRYQRLARKIKIRYEIAINNLADGLRESCNPKEQNFRAEFGALLWTMGTTPESLLFSSEANSSYIPSRYLCQHVVRESINCLPYDPLVQYIWLELKDRPLFNIREHESLFILINAVYHQHELNFGFLNYFMVQEPIFKIYAQTIIQWFKGELTQAYAEKYLQTLQKLQGEMDNYAIMYRMVVFGYVLADQFGLTSWQQRKPYVWQQLVKGAIDLSSDLILFPKDPDPLAKLNHPFLEIINDGFSNAIILNSSDRETIESVFEIVEDFRTSSISYWLKIRPPNISNEEQIQLEHLLESENQLLLDLRNAYFLILEADLPLQYKFSLTTFQNISDLRREISPESARERYRELEANLVSLYKKMERVAPVYAKQRLYPRAGLGDLITALHNHARQ